ncbi:GLPGLI family protein [Rasiella sp. SM2506]|uniref:GLPGLI family protein n=1 Tax=Rasiella sp. SM2506 TaxID=3423914 RepID=UPI003D7B5167
MKIKKSFILLSFFALIHSISLNGQELIVIYGIDAQGQNDIFKKEMLRPDLSAMEKRMMSYSLSAQIEAQKSTYSLEIDKKQSYFYVNEFLFSEFNGKSINELAKVNAYKGSFYQNSNTKKVWEQHNSNKKIITYTFDFFDWELSKETEKILGYTCYKASTQFTDPHPSGSADLVREITVWYTPEIPLNFGPQGYGGLPGLILKKCQSGSCFIAKEIKYKEVEISWPKGETISRKDYYDQFKTAPSFKF